MVIARKAAAECPKKVAALIDLANIPSTLREFVGQSQISRLHCFMRVWVHIKDHKLQVPYPYSPILFLPSDISNFSTNFLALILQDPNDKNVVICDDKLKSVLLGKDRVHLAEIPSLIKLHFPREKK